MQEAVETWDVSKIPSIIPYPEILDLKDMPEIVNQFVYVIKSYPTNGLTVMLYRHDGYVYVQMADFNGKRIDPVNTKLPIAKMGKEFLEKYNKKFLSLMAAAKIPQGLFYVVKQKKKLRLVDMRTSLNKMAGPGMVRDLFSKVMDTQEVIKVVTLTPDIMTAINKGKGSYSGDLILKTSAFKTITRGTKPNQRMYPVYAKVVR